MTAFNYYYGTFEASDGNLWVVGFDEGLHKLDRKTGKFTPFIQNHGNISNCIAEDLDKRLWIGTNGGLKCYNLRTKTYSTAEKLFPSTPD